MSSDAKDQLRPLIARPSGPLSGVARAPGDKSISHRAVMLGALAVGETIAEGLLEGEDVLRTAGAMRTLGAEVERGADGRWRIWGRGIGGLRSPDDILDMGNSGTGARLLLGILASHPITAVVTGDASLRARPMARVTRPLEQFGAAFLAAAGDRLPITVQGASEPCPVRYRCPVASAQVKSAVLLAGLNTPGITSVIEPVATRDHTERMLRHFGARLDITTVDDKSAKDAKVIRLHGEPELAGRRISVPADPSSAAFGVVAALILAKSEVTFSAVGTNPLRSGLLTTLREMGADISIENEREESGEPIADLRVRGSELHGIEVPAARAPSMIDEYPILAVAAAFAKGWTVMRGIGELRVKESDRLAAMARGLEACGVLIEAGEDVLSVRGGNRPPTGGADIEAASDHRIAMSFLVLGLGAHKPVSIDDGRTIDTSFPDFAGWMRRLGADIGSA